MAGGNKPRPKGVHQDKPRIKDGTLCRQESPRPGPIGVLDWGSLWKEQLGQWYSTAGDWFSRAEDTTSGHAKSALLTLLDWLPFKQASPFSTALLKHYVERSGEPYPLENIPKEWEDWIVKATGARPGMHRELNPYNSGLYDLRNSLGHFDVEVKGNKDGTKSYLISDTYKFSATKNDKN